jgi:hypothetical protein
MKAEPFDGNVARAGTKAESNARMASVILLLTVKEYACPVSSLIVISLIFCIAVVFKISLSGRSHEGLSRQNKRYYLENRINSAAS